MKQFTISDLLKILQFDDGLKNDLLSHFEGYPDAKKSEILDILWNGVFELHGKLSELKYQQYLNEVEQGSRELTDRMYLRAKQETWKEIEEMAQGKKQEVEQIESIRQKLQQFIPQSSQGGEV